MHLFRINYKGRWARVEAVVNLDQLATALWSTVPGEGTEPDRRRLVLTFAAAGVHGPEQLAIGEGAEADRVWAYLLGKLWQVPEGDPE